MINKEMTVKAILERVLELNELNEELYKKFKQCMKDKNLLGALSIIKQSTDLSSELEELKQITEFLAM